MNKKDMNVAVGQGKLTKSDCVRLLASATHNGFVSEIQRNIPHQWKLKPSRVKRILARSGYNVSNRSDLYTAPSFYQPNN